MRALIALLRIRLRAFWCARDGNVAIIFGLAVIPILGFIGVSVDYSRANAVKADLQAALDATALMLSKSAATMTPSQLQTAANSHFTALFTSNDALTPTIAASYTTQGGSQLTVNGATSVKTIFAAILKVPYLNIASSSTVNWGNTRLRVALALDVTGSMSSANKMATMKTAAKNLLTQLQNAATSNGDVYVSIVPFAKDVNVGASNYNQNWIKWSGSSDTWDENNGDCSKDTRRREYGTKSACLNAGGSWSPDNHNTWNGCVTDRDQNYDTTNAAPVTATSGTLFPAEEYAACPAQVMGLSYDWTALRNKIDSLQPNGGTNQVIGLAWGFQSLTAAPFTIPAKDANFQYNQVIILLSDGLNTQNRWYGNGTSYDSRVDARQRILCDNVKAAGITLYTVQVNTDNDPTSAVLQYCASDASKFFLLTSANQMIATFSAIGTNLANLRVAK